MHTARRSAALVLVLSAESLGVVLAIRAGTRPPFDLPLDDWEPWSRAAPADALASAVRVVALVAASWLLATTALYLVASVARLPRLAWAVTIEPQWPARAELVRVQIERNQTDDENLALEPRKAAS